MSWIYVKNKVLDWILVWFIKQFLLWVFFEPLLKNWNNLFLLITLRYSWLQERARGRRHGEPNHEWGICYILCFQIFQIQAALVKKAGSLLFSKWKAVCEQNLVPPKLVWLSYYRFGNIKTCICANWGRCAHGKCNVNCCQHYRLDLLRPWKAIAARAVKLALTIFALVQCMSLPLCVSIFLSSYVVWFSLFLPHLLFHTC